MEGSFVESHACSFDCCPLLRAGQRPCPCLACGSTKDGSHVRVPSGIDGNPATVFRSHCQLGGLRLEPGGRPFWESLELCEPSKRCLETRVGASARSSDGGDTACFVVVRRKGSRMVCAATLSGSPSTQACQGRFFLVSIPSCFRRRPFTALACQAREQGGQCATGHARARLECLCRLGNLRNTSCKQGSRARNTGRPLRRGRNQVAHGHMASSGAADLPCSMAERKRAPINAAIGAFSARESG